MENIDIKKVALNSIDELQRIGRQTFYETFAWGNTEKNMNKYLDEDFLVSKPTNDKNAGKAKYT